MRLPGYCTKCRKIKQVRISNSAMARLGHRTPEGVCGACEAEAEIAQTN